MISFQDIYLYRMMHCAKCTLHMWCFCVQCKRVKNVIYVSMVNAAANVMSQRIRVQQDNPNDQD